MEDIAVTKHLFVAQLEELKRCHDNLSNISLIRASAPLRYMLYDSPSIIEILNKEKRLPITFQINDDAWHDDEESLIEVLKWKELSPDLATSTKEVKVQEFLKVPCVYYLKKPLSILDVMKFYAFDRGGVHPPRNDDKYETHRKAFDAIKMNHISSLDQTMRGIVQVVYKSIEKFRDQLLS